MMKIEPKKERRKKLVHFVNEKKLPWYLTLDMDNVTVWICKNVIASLFSVKTHVQQKFYFYEMGQEKDQTPNISKGPTDYLQIHSTASLVMHNPYIASDTLVIDKAFLCVVHCGVASEVSTVFGFVDS